MRAPLSLLSLLVLVLAACRGGIVVTGSAVSDVPDASEVFSVPEDRPAEDSVAPSPDVPRDAPSADAPVQVGMSCLGDDYCAFGARCLQGRCALDTCRTADNPCGDDSRCNIRCVPTRDLCAGVVCGSEETCFLGRCAAGCYPAPCSGITCPAGQFCDDSRGACVPIRPCAGRCDPDYACHIECRPRSNCDGVVCRDTELCVDGRCVPDPCAGVSCGVAALCVLGRCIDTCACDPPCNRSARDRCVVGRCYCASTCTPTTPCGADDGCGGRCVGVCDTPGTACALPAYVCQ